jgi:uncharacterized protein (TIGR02599 family)
MSMSSVSTWVSSARAAWRRRGFTLVELLVGMAVFSLVVVLLFSIISQTSNVWRSARDQMGTYQSSRQAFDRITRTLSQATLNVYEDYDNTNAPTNYIRKSDLHFLITDAQTNGVGGNSIFFQAKLGYSTATNYANLSSLLNAVGYYVSYGADPALKGSALDRTNDYRYRLMQYLQPAEQLKVYASKTGTGWISDLSDNSFVIADNVILVLFWPRLSEKEDSQGNAITLGGRYAYDSRDSATNSQQKLWSNQLPPFVQVTMVAISDRSADRLARTGGSSPPSKITQCFQDLFSTPTVAEYQKDLATLESNLSAAGIGYRVFSSTVPMRESKWNKNR